MKKLFLFLFLSIYSLSLTAQDNGAQFSVGTNLVGYANLVTINAEVGMSVAKKWSVLVHGKYNPFVFSEGEQKQMQHKQITAGAGIRFWPWHVNSGWFVGLGGAIYGV